MTTPPDDDTQPDPAVAAMDRLLQRSEELEDAIHEILDPETYEPVDDSPRFFASFGACQVALEHSRGLRLLVGLGLPTSGVSLMRLQHEALIRATWLMYAASDEDVAKMTATLTVQTEKAASRLPMMAKMLTEIEGKAPLAAVQMLTHFKDVTAPALHSFVHGGIHSVQRQLMGYPLPLLGQVVRNSNGLLVMTGMTLAILSADEAVALLMKKIQPPFADCLPDLLKDPPNAPKRPTSP